MKTKGLMILGILAILSIIVSEITWYRNQNIAMQQNNQYKTTLAQDSNKESTQQSVYLNPHNYAKKLVEPRVGQTVKKFTLTAIESTLQIKKGFVIPVWAFNASVPGTQIRVAQGDFVRIELKNMLKDPVSIHWHGYPMLSAMDGIPGITQDAVKYGETFTYEFSADVAGTYWYHSHQEGSKQVDKGLYGALIVEGKNSKKTDGDYTLLPQESSKIVQVSNSKKPDRDYTLLLDEWMENPMNDMEKMPFNGGITAKNSENTNINGGIPSINDGSTNKNSEINPVLQEEENMAKAYNIYTVNGKSGELIRPLETRKGDLVRLRFVNAGYRSHGIHIPSKTFKVVSTDGQDIEGAQEIKDQILSISPGERYDVEFTVNSEESFFIDVHDQNKFNEQMKIPVKVLDGNGKTSNEVLSTNLQVFDLGTYGKSASTKFTLTMKYDVDYNAELNTRVDANGISYTINGKTFEEQSPIYVKTGDLVKYSFENKSEVDHPMHLHGHFFQVLSKDGKEFSSVIMKDTILVRPKEKYVLAFRADNPGIWVQHCHELHHAAAGMMEKIVYKDFESAYEEDPNNKFNKPE